MSSFDFSKFNIPQFDLSYSRQLAESIQIPEIPEIAEEDTMWYKMEQQHKVLLQQLEQQTKNNELLSQNYNQLRGLYDMQKSEFDTAKIDLKKSKRLNVIMLIIAIVAMLGAIASPIVTWLVTL